MRSTSAFVVTAVVALAGAATACKSSSSTNACGTGTPPSLVGTYALVSYTLGGATVTAPPAIGSLRLHTNTYGVDLTLPQPVGTISDSGAYAIVGASCINESSVLGQPQFTGSFRLIGTTLTVSGSAASQSVVSVWTKTS